MTVPPRTPSWPGGGEPSPTPGISRNRTALQFPVRRDPRAVTPLRLILHAGSRTFPFQPHIPGVWDRLVRPSAGGPAGLVLLPAPEIGRRRRRPGITGSSAGRR